MVVTEYIFYEKYTDEVASDSGFVIETKDSGAKYFFLKFEFSVEASELGQKLLQLAINSTRPCFSRYKNFSFIECLHNIEWCGELIHPVNAESLDCGELKHVSTGLVRHCEDHFLYVTDRSLLVSASIISREVWLRVSASNHLACCSCRPSTERNVVSWVSCLDEEAGEVEAWIASEGYKDLLACSV
jgi:hypothetical protein